MKWRRTFCLLPIITLAGMISRAQIIGEVKDIGKKRPVVDAEVFVDNSFQSVKTDENGRFILDGLTEGFYNIVAYKKFYQPTGKRIKVEKGQASLLIFLSEFDRPVAPRSKSPADDLASFKSDLLGKTHWAEFCHLEDIRNLNFFARDGKTKAYASGPLTINHQAFGYRILYHLLDYTQGEHPIGFTKFERIAAGENQIQLFDSLRFLEYDGNLFHWMEAVRLGTIVEDGFTMNNDKGVALSMNSMVKSLPGVEITSFNLASNINITHRNARGQIHSSRFVVANPVTLFANGSLSEPGSVIVEGHMANKGLAARLPLDYEPPLNKKIIDLTHYFEKVYLSVDRSSYYAGDSLWFKAYLDYQVPEMMNNLSKVLHVELINQHDLIVISQQWKIEDGMSDGALSIPDTLNPGTFALRAYTHWMRNFKAEPYVRFLPLLERGHLIEKSQTKLLEYVVGPLGIKLNKESFHRREKIECSITSHNENGKPQAAWISVSVTDMGIVIPLGEPDHIVRDFKISAVPEARAVEYKLEQGLPVKGQLVNRKGSGLRADIRIMPLALPTVFSFETDENGKFTIEGLDFFGNEDFHYYSGMARAEDYEIKIEPYSPPTVNIRWPIPLAKRIPVYYSPLLISRDTRMLQEITVRGKRFVAESKPVEDNINRPFGNPDYIIKGTDINRGYANIIEALRGKVPGMVISGINPNYSIQIRGSSTFSLNDGPLIVIDDVPSGGASPAEQLIFINIDNVAAVEVTTRINSLYGAAGRGGVIAVFTKSGGLRPWKEDPKSQKKFTLMGYSQKAGFKGINYSVDIMPPETDYRPTLFWSPNIVVPSKTGKTSFSFYASDSIGPYLIVLEGVTQSGSPFHFEQVIKVTD